MRLTIRQKIIIGFIGLDILVSAGIGLSLYHISTRGFTENYYRDKASLIQLVASLLGEQSRKTTSIEYNQHHKKAQTILKKIYRIEKELVHIFIAQPEKNSQKFRLHLYETPHKNKHITKQNRKQWLIRALKEKTLLIDKTPLKNGHLTVVHIYSYFSNSFLLSEGVLVARFNFSPVYQFQQRMVITALGIFLFTLLLTLPGSMLLASYLTRPLGKLTDAVHNIASGDLEAIVRLNRHDEFGELAKGFNAMSKNLKIASEVQANLITEIIQLNESLEKKVQQRTQTIEQQSQEIYRQIQMAKKIQTSLLPQKLPEIDTIQMDYLYFPMMEIGGDFIDVHHYKNHLSIFICDVSGHGVPAAFLATMVKMSLHECYVRKLSPQDSLHFIKNSMAGKMTNHFLSAFFLKIHIPSGKCKYANAGHLPPVLYQQQTNTSSLLMAKGRVIHETLSFSCEEKTLYLKTGDSLVLYTDGITETKNQEREMFGEKRLIKLVNHFSHQTAERLSETIYNSVLKFSRSLDKKFEDDLTLFILQYKHTRS